MTSIETPAPARKKSRPPPRPCFVANVERVTPNTIRIGFTDGDLAAFGEAKPGAHMKLFFAPADVPWPPPPEASRPPSRTYTPRAYDAARNRLDVEFALHGPGLASDWARQAKPGDRMLVSGPGGGYVVPNGIRHLVIFADDTALPGAGMVIEALPADCATTIYFEIDSADDERAPSSRVKSAPFWLHRASKNAPAGSMLESAARDLSLAADMHFWIACEAGAMRRIRDGLVARGATRANLHTRGYWKAGEGNYPDHDYGND